MESITEHYWQSIQNEEGEYIEEQQRGYSQLVTFLYEETEDLLDDLYTEAATLHGIETVNAYMEGWCYPKKQLDKMGDSDFAIVKEAGYLANFYNLTVAYKPLNDNDYGAILKYLELKLKAEKLFLQMRSQFADLDIFITEDVDSQGRAIVKFLVANIYPKSPFLEI